MLSSAPILRPPTLQVVADVRPTLFRWIDVEWSEWKNRFGA